MDQNFRLSDGGLINRDKKLSFKLFLVKVLCMCGQVKCFTTLQNQTLQ